MGGLSLKDQWFLLVYLYIYISILKQPLFRICRNQTPLMQVCHPTEDDGPNDGTDSSDNVLRNEEQGYKDNCEERNGQGTCYLVQRHLKAVWQKVAGFTVLPVGHHGQCIHDNVHIIR